MSVRKTSDLPEDTAVESPPTDNPFFLVAAQVAYTTIGSRNPDATIEALADFGGRLVGEVPNGKIINLGSTLILIAFVPEPPMVTLNHVCIRAARMQEFLAYEAFCDGKKFSKRDWSRRDDVSEQYALWEIPGKVGIKILWQESPYGSEGPIAPPTS